MLSRTADSLFWLARYVERAESLARLIEMGRWMRATPSAEGAARNEWPSILAASGAAAGFYTEARPTADQWPSIVYLMLDRENPSSIASCFENARANARSARAAITVEMWEAINDAWIELRALSPARLENGSLSPLLDWVKQRGALFRGAAESTMLRNDGYAFLSLGFAIERLDSTARLLDVRAGAAAIGDVASDVGESAERHYEWVAILRAAGVLRAYHAEYCADYHPKRVLDFLILNGHCPRSLTHGADRVSERLDALAHFYGSRETCHIAAAGVAALLREASVDEIVERGLHDFLSDIIRRNNFLALTIAQAYHFAPKPAPLAREETVEAPAAASLEQSQSASGASQRQSTTGAVARRVSGAQAQYAASHSVPAE